jgi:hypothetical protein
MAVFAALGAGCASIDDLKDTMSRWFIVEKSLGGYEEDLPGAANRSPPEKVLGEEASKASKKKDKAPSKLHRPQTAELPKKPPISVSTEVLRPQQEADAQSAPSPAPPLRVWSPWPEAPASGTFSH